METTQVKYGGVGRGGNSSRQQAPVRLRGFSLVELVVVLFILVICLALVVPQIRRAVYTMRLRAAASELAGVMQNARISAAKNNQIYDIKYTTFGGDPAAYVDLNLNGVYDVGEPVVVFNRGVTPAAGPPTGVNGQPPPFILNGDTCAPNCNAAYDNTATLAFNRRGLPCNYSVPPTCVTPAATYFVFYLNGNPGWSAVVVTIAGRTRVVVWDGANWNN
jgi:prepilin-type N-terminal cleavage/methylation domain-containing protein